MSRRGIGLKLPKATIGVSRWRHFRARFDWPLVIAVALVSTVGLVNLYSATYGTPHTVKFDQQVRWLVIAIAGFFVATFVDYRTLVRAAWPLLGIATLAIIVVHLLGEASAAKGSHRWINLGPIRIQPSEPAKLAVILAMARFLEEPEILRDFRQWLPRLGAIALPIFLVAIQPDLGSSVLLALIALSIAYLALPKVWPAAVITLAGLAAVPVLWDNMHRYQKLRVLAFLDPDADPTGSGWHTRQSIFAVGSGKTTGKGFMEGTQNQFDFLPEHWTDFPFSVFAEEWGFLGSLALLIVFVFLFFWVLHIGGQARDRASSIICIGVAALLFWHVFINIAMVLGMAPVVGVTLPFISYGGSSLLTCFLGIGMVASVSMRRHGY